MIPFNKPCICGNELLYIADAIQRGKISGDGYYTQKCQQFFEDQFGYKKVFLTNSCTDALEMAAILLNIKSGDEVIMPSFTHVSTANAFILRGAKIVFVDVESDLPNIRIAEIEKNINANTKAIVVVHYGGISVDMHGILQLAIEHNLFIVEDAAAALGGSYNTIPLGTVGHLAAFSFHETKNIQCGEGGMLVINDDRFIARAAIIWEKGTDRVAFNKKEVASYHWQDVGSSFLPSELNAAFLLGQLDHYGAISAKRKLQWEYYQSLLSVIATPQTFTLLPERPYARHNHHVMALVCASAEQRTALINYLLEADILAVSHYRALHQSPYFLKNNAPVQLPNSLYFETHLLRLPLYNDLEFADIDIICDKVKSFFLG